MKKDIKISLFIGLGAGILLALILNNLKFRFVSDSGVLTSVSAILGLAVLTTTGYSIAFFASRKFPAILQFAKFGIVGGFNFLVDLGVLNLLIYFSGIDSGFRYSIFKACSFLVAVIGSYFLNKYWTFQSSANPRAAEFIKFFVVNLIGFGLNVGTASLVVNVIGAPLGVSGKAWASIGAILASLVGLVWNFIGMKFIVFKR